MHVTSVPTNANASIGIIPTFGYIWAVALNEELYCYGGINQHEQSGYVWFGVNEKYNLKTGTWTKVTPPAQGSIAVVACQNKIYSIGAQTQVYDPSTDTWINKTAMPKTLLKTNANVVDNKIYVISGAEYASLAGVYSSEATYQYDPETDSWSTLASIPTPVEGYASAVLDGKIYIIGGAAMSQNYSNQVVNLVQVFNPKTNHWTTGKPLPTGVYAAGACATTGVNAAAKIYVVGGHTHYVSWVTSAILSPHGTTLNQIFDPATGEWSLGASLPQPRWQCTLINVNDTLIIVGGENGPADSSLFDNPEKIVLDIERYVPTGYQDILPSAVPQDTSGSLQPENTNYLYLTIAPAIILAITFTALLIFRSKRKTRFPSSFKR
ncbi:MAG: Kelch repeat-containing protein [Candidatus Bathyarchaeia archaeon]